MRTLLILPAVLLAVTACGQEQLPAPPPVPTLPPATPAPSKPVLQNSGVPMSLPFECGDEDIQTTGLTCTVEHPCAVYLELTSVEAAGARLFVTGNLHTASSTLSSVLLASDDGGKTWQEPHERIRLAILEQIQFLDFETGWVGGQIVRPLPRDPFLLLTTDGGKTWRQRPLFDEPRIGAIEKFWFESRTEGSLWLDRTQSGEIDSQYERYETMTGGESWNVREASAKSIPIKGAAATPRNPGWRVRAHAASGSYRIEKRQGQTWQMVSAFSIEVGECKPKEQILAEPIVEPQKTEEEHLPGPAKAPSKRPSKKRGGN
jgi:hypothetical protein